VTHAPVRARALAVLLLLVAGAATAQTAGQPIPEQPPVVLPPVEEPEAPLAPPGEPFGQLGDPAVDARPGPPGTLSPGASAALLTMLPGREIYSLFGHSALRLTDPATGLDRTYNYGTFDFQQPLFVPNFVLGKLDYILDTAPYPDEVARYEWLGRPIIEQPLALDAATVQALYRRLEVNALPENRAYRYRFFYDNCSTRLLDVLDGALADAGHARVQLQDEHATDSFRDLLRPYIAGNPALWAGMSTILGTPGDAVATTRQRTFLPLELAHVFDGAMVENRPLVLRRDTVFQVAGAGMPAPAFPWPAALLWGLFSLGAVATLATWKRTPGKLARALDTLLLAGVGLLGVLVGFLWFATEHEVMGPNAHLVWAWPTHLVAAVVVARGRIGRKWRRYFAVAAVVSGLAALLWLGVPQGMPAALLPIPLLVALRCAARARTARPAVAAD